MGRGLHLPRRVSATVAAAMAVAVGAVIARSLGLSPGVAYDIAWSTAALAATVACHAAATRALAVNRGRWRLWTLASLSWLIAQLVWNLYGIVGYSGDPNPADVGWWGFAVLVMISVAPRRGHGRSLRALAASEAVPLICAAIGLCLSLLWIPFHRSQLPMSARISDLVYPCVYATATILTLQSMLGGSLRGLRSAPARLFLAGTTTISIAFMLWSRQLLTNTYVPGTSALDPLWVIGLGLIAMGGLIAAGAPEAEPVEAEPSQVGVILPAGMFLLLGGVLLSESLAGAPTVAKRILLVGVLCSGAALIVRSGLLSRRMRGLLERERATSAALVERESELARLNHQLIEDSRHDPLTGIGNRRALADDIPVFMARQREAREPIAVLLCDVDHFKSYNDTFGHLAGDRALTTLTGIVRGSLRSQDSAYRFGGEELLVVLRGAGPEQALQVAERIRAAVADAGLTHPLTPAGHVTVSVGLACGLEAPEDLISRADAALYEAKESGRDRVVESCNSIARAAAALHRDESPEEPAARHLRSMLAVSRAAASGQGTLALLEALSEAIRVELSFSVVVSNLLEGGDRFRTMTVSGDSSARELLLGTTMSMEEWTEIEAVARHVHGALWLPAGTYVHDENAVYWRAATARTTLSDEGWHPEDMLLLPLRNAAGELTGFVSVDQPVLGRRPTDAQIAVLMGVVDHAGLALEQIQIQHASVASETDALRLAAVMLLAETLDLRDPGTASHSRTVGALACATARELHLAPERVDRVRAAGVLHDLGKLGIPDAILQKPGKLDDAEWREMRRHPEIGARILEHSGLQDIAVWVRAHHERIDGRGYPLGLASDTIPLEARILSVADSFEAMVTDRPYRRGMSVEAACAELRACAGAQFDPDVVTAFLRALAHAGPECDFSFAPFVGAVTPDPAVAVA